MTREDGPYSLEIKIGDLLVQLRELNLVDKRNDTVQVKNLINKRKQLLQEIKDLLSHRNHQ
jgi:hypothetical protein